MTILVAAIDQPTVTCSKLTIETLEQGRHSGVFIVNFEHFTSCSSVSVVNFEHVIAGWETSFCH